MAQNDQIQYKKIPSTWVISQRVVLESRDQLSDLYHGMRKGIPDGAITGPPFCIITFVTSITGGSDAELCFPVLETIEQARCLPEMEVLSLIHKEPLEELVNSYRTLYAWAAEQGIVSDEFCREVYPDLEGMGEIEIQFVIHPWEHLLESHLTRVLGSEKARQVAQGRETLTIQSSLAERFEWVCGAVTRLEAGAGEGDHYQVLSSCSHVFPAGQVAKLRSVYLNAEEHSGDRLAAVDAVIDFMGEDPGWGEKPRREGYIIYSSKKPRDPAGYEKAVSKDEKRKAYCFCPLIRENLDGGIPAIFCYCGAGWYRQQWEGAIGEPVQVEIVRSLLKGDDQCEFAVHLPVQTL